MFADEDVTLQLPLPTMEKTQHLSLQVPLLNRGENLGRCQLAEHPESRWSHADLHQLSSHTFTSF